MLSEHEKRCLLQLARDTLEACVRGKKIPPFKTDSPALKASGAAFVSLHTKQGRLRGCIGSIEPVKPLWETIQSMTISSALHDSRFEPVTEDELDNIEIEISVISPFKQIKSLEEIDVGKHGLYIIKGFYSGLLLPQVATQYGWDRTEFLQHVCLKAGLPQDAYKSKDAQLYIFTAEIFSEKEFR